MLDWVVRGAWGLCSWGEFIFELIVKGGVVSAWGDEEKIRQENA